MESDIQEFLESELCEYEKQVLSTRRFSDIQKYLALITKKPTFLQIVHNSKMSVDHDERKSEMFNKFVAIVFGQNVKRPHSLELVYKELKYIIHRNCHQKKYRKNSLQKSHRNWKIGKQYPGEDCALSGLVTEAGIPNYREQRNIPELLETSSRFS